MIKSKKIISLLLAVMLTLSMFICTSAYADTDENSDTSEYATGFIQIDNLASGGFAAPAISCRTTAPWKI